MGRSIGDSSLLDAGLASMAVAVRAKTPIAIVTGSIVLLIAAGLLLSTATWSPVARLSLQTVSAAELAPNGLGIQLSRPAPWSRPAVSEATARTVATRNVPGLSVQHVSLAWITTTNSYPAVA